MKLRWRALYRLVQSSVMVSSWMRWTCRAFSSAIAVVEALRPDAVDQLDHAQAVIAEAHRHGYNRARLHLGLLVHLGEKARVLAHVGHDDNLIVLRHPAGDALPHLDADTRFFAQVDEK